MIEWPERLEGALPSDRLDVEIAIPDDGERPRRSASPAMAAGWAVSSDPNAREETKRRFLAEAGLADAVREALPMDASTSLVMSGCAGRTARP